MGRVGVGVAGLGETGLGESVGEADGSGPAGSSVAGPEAPQPLTTSARNSTATARALREHEGDALVFLPGAGEIALQISKMELAACFSQTDHAKRLTYDDFRLCIDGKASGAVRISVGMVSNFEDVERLLEFTAELTE